MEIIYVCQSLSIKIAIEGIIHLTDKKEGETLPRKTADNPEGKESEQLDIIPQKDISKEEIEKLNHMLAAVLNYISDDEVEVIDIDYLLNNTEGLRDWWDQYRERNRKKIEEEISKALGDLSIEELENLREKIKGKDKE
ncbi:hypothetical protein [Mesobacillus jeotgali]|uniref:Uncharacterized protein n=1 Tax=Mesobacillus jeotgali TaxID=129985 RepID=A0ABY9VL52_9BACI|nr:hypothetical protein [Mesobacillus jeotgali]WNF24687.1 hypothetical protein RH061_09440 [Mesobacillus jeotgali]